LTDITIIRPAAEHRAAWDVLYKGYADFYKVEQTSEMRDRVGSWLHDANHTVKGFLAVDSTGMPVGLTHHRPFAWSLMADVRGQALEHCTQWIGGIEQQLDRHADADHDEQWADKFGSASDGKA
jgi:hypothetical protein